MITMYAPAFVDGAKYALLSLSTPSGRHVESLTVAATRQAIGAAIIRFANRHGIAASMVAYSVGV